jgi:hypothetical protein
MTTAATHFAFLDLQELRREWGWFLALGILLMIAGIVSGAFHRRIARRTLSELGLAPVLRAGNVRPSA